MDPLTIAAGLVSIAPTVARWIGGDGAGDRAAAIVATARRVVGDTAHPDPAAAIAADPALTEAFRREMAQLELSFYQAETARLEAVNATMRAEVAGGGWRAGWRPAFGYAMAVAFATQMLALTWLILFRPSEAPGVIAALAQLTALWGIGLSVVGVAVWQRSAEKMAVLSGGGR